MGARVTSVSLTSSLVPGSSAFKDEPCRLSLRQWIAGYMFLLIFLGAIGGALQFTAYTWALNWLTPTRTAIYLTLTPISAIILAYPLLGENVKIEAIVGLIFVLTAVFLLNRARLRS